jgi:hypothetical protein
MTKENLEPASRDANGRSKYYRKITERLLSLEEEGDLVLTSTSPERVAEALFHAAIKAKFAEAFDEPIECTMPHLLDLTAAKLSARFGIEGPRAREIATCYYKKWLETRTIAEVAQVYWHETPYEMAGRAFYHIELGKPDDRDFDYLDWRKSQSAE